MPNMSAQPLLSRLEGVKQTGKGKWQAKCPAHRDRSPSLSISELSDTGAVLVYCHAGCSFEKIIAAAGVDVAELFPAKIPVGKGHPPIRRPFIPADAFNTAIHEISVAWIIAADLRKKQTVSDRDFVRLSQAVRRLENIAERVY
jgi:hypothetical protein